MRLLELISSCNIFSLLDPIYSCMDVKIMTWVRKAHAWHNWYFLLRMPYSISDFELIQRLGDGSYSQVILVRHKVTKTLSALKVVDKYHVIKHHVVEGIKRERRLLEMIDDPGIVNLLFTFQDSSNLYLGLEPCVHGELFDQIRMQGVLPLESARVYAAEIVLILEALRKYNIVHRDIKPENILLDGCGHLKLADFGSAKDLNEGTGNVPSAPAHVSSSGEAEIQSDRGDDANIGTPVNNDSKERRCIGQQKKRNMSLVGTADYVPPEVLENTGEISPAADLWAFGCVLYQMLMGKTPFKGASEYLTFQNIIGGKYKEMPEARVGREAIDLVHKLLKADPRHRLGADSISEIKEHAFFNGIKWKSIRDSDAPEFARVDSDSDKSRASSFDWELMSLAKALPE